MMISVEATTTDTTTALEMEQKTYLNNAKRNYDQEPIVTAAHIAVIKSTNSITRMNTEESNGHIDTECEEEPKTTKKVAEKKPYGGRPLKYECPECKRRFHAPSHLKRHVMSHSSERPFHCDICNKGFLQAWHLGRHKTTHTGVKPFNCTECSKSFGSRFEMKTHINYIHKGIKEHQCDVCNKHFTLRSNLKVHMRKHTGEKPYQCSFCPRKFGQRGHLQYHIRKHEGENCNRNEKDLPRKDTALVARKNESFGCERKSVSEQSCESHEDDASTISDKDSGIGSYDSEIESNATSSCSSPRMHELSDDRLYGCDKTSLQRDARAQSPEYDLLLKPEQCDRKRPNMASEVLTGLKPYVCYPCNCGFAHVSSLRAHVRHSHPRKQISSGDYRCAFCHKSYSNIEALHDHIEKHGVPSTGVPSIPRLNVIQKRQLFTVQAAVEKPRLSAKSLAFSIERICADDHPKRPKMAQITHFHSATALPFGKQSFNYLTSNRIPTLLREDYHPRIPMMQCCPSSPSSLGSAYHFSTPMAFPIIS